MSINLNEFFGDQALTDRQRDFVTSEAVDILPAGLTNRTRTVAGNQGVIDFYRGHHRVSRYNDYNGIPHTATKADVDRKLVRLLSVAEELPFDELSLQELLSDIPSVRERAVEKIGIDVREVMVTQRQTYLTSIYSALFSGMIGWDANGYPVASREDSRFTTERSFDFGIPAGNQNQLSILGTARISASWATTSTNISQQMSLIQADFFKLTGKQLKYAIHGANVPGYLFANDFFGTGTALSTGFDQVKGGQIPPGTWGIAQWIPGNLPFINPPTSTTDTPSYDSHLTTPDGTEDKIVLIPEPDPSWYQMLWGTRMIPSGIGVSGSALENINSNTRVVSGPYSYAVNSVKPYSVEQVMGNTWFPAIVNSNCILQANVVF